MSNSDADSENDKAENHSGINKDPEMKSNRDGNCENQKEEKKQNSW